MKDLAEYKVKVTDLRHIVHEFQKMEENRVTLSKFYQKLKTDLIRHSSNETLRVFCYIISNSGGAKCRTAEKCLLRNVVLDHFEFDTQEIVGRYFRSNDMSIIYLDETYVYSGHTFSKNWTNVSTKGLFVNIYIQRAKIYYCTSQIIIKRMIMKVIIIIILIIIRFTETTLCKINSDNNSSIHKHKLVSAK